MRRHFLSALVIVLLLAALIPSLYLLSKGSRLKSKAANPVMLNLYVAPGGDDANDGLSADKPFKTLERARDVVRTFTANMTGDIVVNLRQGVYHLSQPFQLTSLDSGKNGFNVVWQNFTNEVPEISSGKVITGWQQDTGGKWKANVGVGVVSRQLYVNGVRAIRARSADGLGFSQKLGCASNPPTASGSACTGYVDVTSNSLLPMSKWGNLKNVEFVGILPLNGWKQFRCPVDSISGGQIFLQQPCWNNSQLHIVSNSSGAVWDFTMGPVSWVENALELLDQPGYWYLDQSSGWLYYYPKTGENMTTAEVILPTLETLVSGTGTLDQPISNIRFKGIQFSYATWLQPNTADGYADLQAGTFFKGAAYPSCDNRGVCKDTNGKILPLGAWPQMPGNVSFISATNVGFENNTFIHLGAAAVNCTVGCKAFQVIGSHITDVSGSGVRVGDVDQPNTTDDRLITRDTLVKNNYIHNIGTEYWDNVGVWLGYTQNSQVANNEIFDLPYSGVSMGWGWGVNDYLGGTFDNINESGTLITVAKNNAVRNNFIHDYVKLLYDGGAIYTLSAQPTSTISGNRVLNTPHENGIYLDEHSRYFDVFGNSVMNVYSQSLFGNKGGNRNIHDNYFQTGHDLFLAYFPNGASIAPDNVYNNPLVSSELQVPATILSAAGIESGYASVTNSPCLPAELPTNLKPASGSAVPAGNLTLSWDPVPGVANYLVRVWDQTLGSWGGCLSPNDVCSAPTTNSFSTTVQSGHQYSWWVHGVSSCGVFGWPGVASFVQAAAVPSPTPTPSPTPPPAGTSILLKAKFAGISSDRGAIKATRVIVQDKVAAGAVHSFRQVFEGSSALTFNFVGGSYQATIPGLNLNTTTTYEVLIKGPSHLQTRVTPNGFNITALPSGSTFIVDATATSIRAGDVMDATTTPGTPVDGQDGKLTIEDLSAITFFYTSLAVPLCTAPNIPAGCQNIPLRRDINKDGFITIDDITLISNNFTSTAVLEDQ